MIYLIKNVQEDLTKLPKPLTINTIDNLIIQYLARNYEIETNIDIIKSNKTIQWIYFYTNVKRIKSGHNDRLNYIMDHVELLTDPNVVDNLYSLIYKCDYETLQKHSLECSNNSSPYVRRFAYAMFISHPNREKMTFANNVLGLIKNDEPIVMEAVVKLIYDLCIFNPTTIYLYLCKKVLSKENTKLVIDALNKSTRLDVSYKNRLKVLLNSYEN